MAEPPATLSTLLHQLQTSLTSAIPHLPSEDAILPPENGISLLDTKTDLFLSYLQNLVFLILVKFQDYGSRQSITPSAEIKELDKATVKRLAELRLYLEKGVRPLEGRLKYQIEKVIRAAETTSTHNSTKNKTQNSRKPQRSSASDSSASSSDDDGEEEINNLAYRPNTSAFIAPQQRTSESAKPTQRKDGIYRPPKINPTSLPTTADMNATPDARRGKSQRPLRAAAVDDYIATEMTDGPAAEPSIGSTITRGGRGTKTDRERRKEEERTRYEENNFIRLPKEGNRERGKRKREGGFGASELGLGSLGEMGDRVARAVGSGKKMRV